MDEATFNSILENRDSIIPEQPEEQFAEPTVEDGYACKYPGCNKTFKDRFGLMGHSRTHKKDKEDTQLKDAKLPSLSLNALPENLSYLRTILKSFSAKNIDNVLSGMLDSPENLDELRDLLVASGTDTKAHPLILRRYSTFIGQPLAIQPEGQQIAVKPETGAKAVYKQFMEDRAEQAYLAMMEKQAYGSNGNQKLDDVKISALEAQVKELKDLLVQNQLKNEIEKLKEEKKIETDRLREEIKQIKESNESGLSTIVNSFKEYMTEDSHKWQMFQKDQQYNQELSKLREEIRNSGSNLSIGERMIEKIDRTINNAGAGFAELNKHVLRENAAVEKADRALILAQAGFQPSQIEAILGNPQPRGTVPPGSSEKIWQEMQRASERPIPQPEPAPIQITDTLQEPEKKDAKIDFSEHIVKFNSGGD